MSDEEAAWFRFVVTIAAIAFAAWRTIESAKESSRAAESREIAQHRREKIEELAARSLDTLDRAQRFRDGFPESIEAMIEMGPEKSYEAVDVVELWRDYTRIRALSTLWFDELLPHTDVLSAILTEFGESATEVFDAVIVGDQDQFRSGEERLDRAVEDAHSCVGQLLKASAELAAGHRPRDPWGLPEHLRARLAQDPATDGAFGYDDLETDEASEAPTPHPQSTHPGKSPQP